METDKQKKGTEKSKFAMFLNSNLNYIIAIVVFLIFVSFGFLKMGKTVENSVYDTLLKIKPEIEQRDDILLLNVDDFAIEQVGSWPWSRDVIADALIRLKEVGGSAAVFDIEYLSAGRTGANNDFVEQELPKEYKAVRNEFSEYISQFSQAISSKTIPLSDVTSVGSDMSSYFENRINELSTSITTNVFRDNDAYMGDAVRFFENAFLTINAVDINLNTDDKELKQFAYENLLFSNIEDSEKLLKKETLANRKRADEDYGMAPAIMPIIKNAKGAGFPNVVIDEDGVRRRISLFSEYDGKYIGQLVFAPILIILDPEKIIRKKQFITLVNAKDPKDFTKRKNITLPLDEDGCLLINWLKKRFVDAENPKNGSFKSLSIYSLTYADKIEKNLISLLESIKDLQISTADGYLSYHNAILFLQDEYAKLHNWKTSLLKGEKKDFDEYFNARKSFFEDYETFLNANLDEEIHQLFKTIKDTTGSTEYDEVDAYVASLFDSAKNEYQLYTDHINYIKPFCENSFAVIGYSGVGTSDLGVNPFWNSYPNVGTHANIYNTVMNEAFITPLPKWISILVAFLLAMICAFSLKKIEKSYKKIIFGIALLVSVLAIDLALFIFGLIYLQLFVIVATIVFSFIIILFMNFVLTEKEKSFLRKAFGVYLSDDVVNEIVADPERLALGGEQKRITALFTDIRSFSTLSEKITPEHLVSVLNVYLTKMSDLILIQKGTIDKYIGDAIVSFFGAPIDLPNHASKACLAAIRMKQAEEELNKELYDSGDIPMPIFTRIGINTGEMVVGNMGTEKKMNYTIMGNDVNLAARLEGVNKKYGTWILASESTWDDTDGEFLGRRLDRVRVVGINTPVQLYNVMAVKEEADKDLVEMVKIFEEGISFYRERKYSEALEKFRKCLEIIPDDEPSKMYSDRMKDLLANENAAKTHDDIVNMTSK